MSSTQALKEMIWQVVASIPRGRVASYGEVARLCGYPSHARFVGTTLKKLPNDSKLPWHRVLSASGKIAFAEGSDQYNEQRQRLISEGVLFRKTGRIDMRTFGLNA